MSSNRFGTAAQLDAWITGNYGEDHPDNCDDDEPLDDEEGDS